MLTILSLWQNNKINESNKTINNLDSVIKKLDNTLIASNSQTNLLGKIILGIDSTNKNTTGLNDLPVKLKNLGLTIDNLSLSLIEETKNLKESYGQLNKSSEYLMKKQGEYLIGINSLVEKTNEQMNK